MDVNRLVLTVEATHQSLQQRLDEAARPVSRTMPREAYQRIDTFMAAVSRHLAAAEEVLADAASRRLDDGTERVHAYLHQTRVLELAITRLKARLYGEVHAAHLSWAQVWDDTRRELVTHNDLERELVTDLAGVVDQDEADRLAEKVYRSEVHAPTRAHPYIPHSGVLGHLARKIWAVADRFWDTAEGRVVPAPVKPPPKRHDSLLAQYLVGEPHLDDRAPLVSHRKRVRRGERHR